MTNNDASSHLALVAFLLDDLPLGLEHFDGNLYTGNVLLQVQYFPFGVIDSCLRFLDLIQDAAQFRALRELGLTELIHDADDISGFDAIVKIGLFRPQELEIM